MVLVDLGAEMIALRSPTTCMQNQTKSIRSSGRSNSNSNNNGDEQQQQQQQQQQQPRRRGTKSRENRTSFMETSYDSVKALKTVILFTFLIVPDLIRCERANAQQNNYHTTAGRHIQPGDQETDLARTLSTAADLAGLRAGEASPPARFERASIAANAPNLAAEQPDHLNNHNGVEMEEESTGFPGAGRGRPAPEEASSADDLVQASGERNQLGAAKLHIVRLFAPEAVKNGTQNVTIDCMFKFDKKLDQRLTIKWFYNDELEPIYQWIPELNKRVFSDRYERFLDKSYEVTEDADFMLQAYRWLLSGGTSGNSNNNYQQYGGDLISTTASGGQHQQQQQVAANERAQLEASRRALASRLNKLAKLGGQHSRHLLDSLRAALNMDELDYSRFRALRLVKPTTELNGRFTCSVSSLDGDDLRSTRLLVYEPAKSFQFNVSRVANQAMFNLTCQADQLFPRPALALFRYRAGPLEPHLGQLQHQPQNQQQPVARRPRLAATSLRQEPIAGSQTQLLVKPVARSQHSAKPETDSDLSLAEPNEITKYLGESQQSASGTATGANQQPTVVYEISSWALVDEASLSSNVVTQFECLLSIEGTGYEQRHSLALQRGWHVNSASVALRSTLVGLFSALASLLCLILALVSSMLIFRLLRRHAKNRVHEQKSDGSDTSNVSPKTTEETVEAFGGNNSNNNNDSNFVKVEREAREFDSPQPPPPPSLTLAQAGSNQQFAGQPAADRQQVPANDQSDGVYRVPFGTRFIIGPGSRSSAKQQYYGPLVAGSGSSFAASSFANHANNAANNTQGSSNNNNDSPRQTSFDSNRSNHNISNNKPLYC